MNDRPQPELGAQLETLRNRKRFSKEALGRVSGISAGYIGQLERGFDPRTGKALRPSPTVLRMLADALGDGNRAEADRIYQEFMVAAGYVQGERSTPNSVEKSIEQRILENDPDLQVQFHRVAQYWEDFTDAEKASVKSYLKFAAEEHRRRSGGNESNP